MQKKQIVTIIVPLALVFGITCPGYAFQATQASQPASSANAAAVEMPHSPDALMALAHKLNGLTGDEIKPWHLKMSYAITDAKGATTEQGTYEEFWASAQKRRTIYTVGKDSQITYITDKGEFQTASPRHPSSLALELEREIVGPLSGPDYPQHTALEIHTQKFGTADLGCVQEKPADGIHRTIPAPEMFCFNLDQPILRVHFSAYDARQAVRNQVIRFQGRYVPKGVRVLTLDKTTLEGQVEELATIPQIVDDDFTPPADAKPVPRRISFETDGVKPGVLLKMSHPDYPVEAKAARVSGMVVIEGIVGIDGHVHDLEVLSGPVQLRRAAFDSVGQWEYRPTLLNGEPVEARIQVGLNFR